MKLLNSTALAVCFALFGIVENSPLVSNQAQCELKGMLMSVFKFEETLLPFVN